MILSRQDLSTDELNQRYAQCLQSVQQFSAQGKLTEQTQQQLTATLCFSSFIENFFNRQPQWFEDFNENNFLNKPFDLKQYRSHFEALTLPANSKAEMQKKLRVFRNQHMIRIAHQDYHQLSDLAQTTLQLSLLADCCIQLAIEWATNELQPGFGLPFHFDELKQSRIRSELIVLGMGKLGAFELNYSSDIDLIFVFPEHGETSDGRKSISNNEYFIKLGQQVIQLLNTQTADGFVFRVDMRLRPFGQSGPLAITITAMEDYYAVHGREWERYAMIKARPICGDAEDIESLNQVLRPFVYRRYTDFNVFESLREMKALIDHEVQSKRLEHNIKLGKGGIREIEFLAQAFQLLKGGRDKSLQQPALRTILPLLRDKQLIPAQICQQLLQAYIFLRNTEHRIQAFEDKQTHELPNNSLQQELLALAMGCTHYEQFLTQLAQHRENVQSIFAQLFVAPQANQTGEDERSEQLAKLWQKIILAGEHPEQAEIPLLLSECDIQDFEEANAIVAELLSFVQSSHFRRISADGRLQLQKLMPLILAYLQRNPINSENEVTPLELLQRILPILESICRRTTYLALLIENPMALSQLMQLCQKSVWISKILKNHPLLLDELIDPRSLYSPLNKKALHLELSQQIKEAESQDLEQQMEILRQFKLAQNIRVAAAELTTDLKTIKASDYLTWTAEVIIHKVLKIAWKDCIDKYGNPANNTEQEEGFAIIAYGKLGGKELGYGSDLDLVFVCNEEAKTGSTQLSNDSQKAISKALFYTRLAQRIMHILNTRTYSGQLYECDLRLRPNGNSGQLVCPLSALQDYLQKDAWTWEHQALCRARFVAGDKNLKKPFQKIRQLILQNERKDAQLRDDIIEMRSKMKVNLEKHRQGHFDIKQASGAMVDIEFMVQYQLLKNTRSTPQIAKPTSNIKILKRLMKYRVIAKKQAKTLIRGYQLLRKLSHQQTLQENANLAQDKLFKQQRLDIQKIWQQWFNSDL